MFSKTRSSLMTYLPFVDSLESLESKFSPKRRFNAGSLLCLLLFCLPAGLTRAASALPTVTITNIVPNDDSAKITFNAVPGAVDYRVYNVNTPGIVKYSGGSTTVEENALGPVSQIVVEAVDAAGPFQDMDPYLMATLDPTKISMIINGQGNPTNTPNVIARSAVTQVVCMPRRLYGQQAFFDNFQNNQPFVPGTLDPVLATMHTFSSTVCYEEYQNDKWNVTLFDHDKANTRIFFMAKHFMDILYDFHSILRAKTVLVPKQTVTLQPGQALHVTFEADPHLSLNRTLGLLVLPASDKITYPPAGGSYTTQGNIFDWQIAADAHHVSVFTNGNQDGVGASPGQPFVGSRWVQQWASGPMGGGLNGSDQDLDRRHRYDLFLTATKYLILEEGQMVGYVDMTQSLENGNTVNETLKWFYNKPLKVAFYHYLYHSVADHYYLTNGEMFPLPEYWLNRRPYSDERHWDNMGFEVLNVPKSLQ